jgi:hypothetical protein
VDHGASQREHDAGVRHHGDAAVETTWAIAESYVFCPRA